VNERHGSTNFEKHDAIRPCSSNADRRLACVQQRLACALCHKGKTHTTMQLAQQHYSVFGCVSSNGSVSWIRYCRMQVTRAEYALLILSFFAILQSEALRQASSWRPVWLITSTVAPLTCPPICVNQLYLCAAGLEVGILAGLVASTFYFAFCYARVPCPSHPAHLIRTPLLLSIIC